MRLASAVLTWLAFGAAASGASYDQCIVALNSSAANALSISGTVTVNANGCGVVVDSSSTTALRVAGNARVAAKYINVAGGTSVANNATVTPAPLTQASRVPDPLSFLIRPTLGQCDYSNTSINTTESITLSPGTYCNGISIAGSANVTLNPGTYILWGGGLNIRGSSSVSGANVTFFITGGGTGQAYAPVSVTGSAVVNLSAPTSVSSPYYGILFFQDPAIGAGKPASMIAGSSDSTIEGVLYFPTTGLTYAGSSQSGNYLVMVADTVTLTGSATINSNFPTTRPPLEPPVQVSGVNPPAVTLYPGQSVQFTPVVSYSSQGVTWAINPANAGTIDASGVYTAPAQVTSQQTVTITATSVEDPTKSALAAVNLMPPIAVMVTPATATLYGSQTRQFTAAVVNTNNTAVTWSLSPAGAGSVNASGLYSAPASISTQQMVIVTATSQADATKSAAATVTLMPPVAVTVIPATATAYAGQTLTLTPTVINTTNTGVTWTLNAGASGTISAAGVYSAPGVVPSQQTVTVTVTSQADPTKSATATITLVPLSVSVTPATTTLFVGQTQQFTPIVNNATNTSVTWS